jgi:hypothetical protein
MLTRAPRLGYLVRAVSMRHFILARRPLGILLLALFAVWATGAERLVHELTEHMGGGYGGACGVSVDGAREVAGAKVQASDDCDPDDCATCLSLASLGTDSTSPPAPPVVRPAAGEMQVERPAAVPAGRMADLLPPARAPPVIPAC